MAIKQSLNFGLQVYGDGTSTSLTVTLATSALDFTTPTGGALQPAFLISSLVPTGVTNLSCSDGTGVTGSIGLFGLTMTLTFATALALGSFPAVTGTFIF